MKGCILRYTFNSKPLWHSVKDVDIEAYKRTLDGRLKLCSLNSCIISNSMHCVCDVFLMLMLYVIFITILLMHVKLQ